MIEVNIHQAKTQLSRLIAKVEQGEEVVITRAGEPVAKLVRAEQSKRSRKLGEYAGRIWIADDFDAPLDPETFKPQYEIEVIWAARRRPRKGLK